ncbi:hypothetical protein K438DRAFT_716614 [Mycena galopus ATCC 62051]|nr:hypothetical protein K438DRAFT_716614 [Mycena galopus ATCC 62051]
MPRLAFAFSTLTRRRPSSFLPCRRRRRRRTVKRYGSRKMWGWSANLDLDPRMNPGRKSYTGCRRVCVLSHLQIKSVSLKKAEKRKTESKSIRKGGERKAQHRALATDRPLRRRSHRITPLIARPSSARSRSGRHLPLSLLRTPSFLRAIHHLRLDSTLGTHEAVPVANRMRLAGTAFYHSSSPLALDEEETGMKDKRLAPTRHVRQSRRPTRLLRSTSTHHLLARASHSHPYNLSSTHHDYPFWARVRIPESRAPPSRPHAHA